MEAGVLRGTATRSDSEDVYSILPRPLAWPLRSEHSIVALGAAAGVSYLLLTAVMIAAAGAAFGLSWGDVVVNNVTYALYFGGIPIAVAVLVRGQERDARDLAPLLGAQEGGEASLRREALAVTPCALWLGVLVGLLMTVGAGALILERLGELSAAWVLFFISRELAIEVAFFGAMGWGVGAALQLSRLTQERALPDLVDPRPFAPLARNGARLAAVWLVFMGITVPLVLAPPEEFVQISGVLLVLMLVLASFAIVAVLLPCRGARRAIRAAKRRELAEVRSQIGEARRTREDERLPGLLAWEARIERLSEWPVDATALRRTGLFLLLPLASWVGSALVERLVDSSLG